MLLTKLPAKILPVRAVHLTGDVALIVFQPDDASTTLRLLSGEPPYGTVDVLSTFGSIKIAATRLPLAGGADTIDEIAPIIFGAEIAELSEELDLASRRRLLGFLLGFCRKAFSLGDSPQFARACITLAQHCVTEEPAAIPVARVAPTWLVLSGPASQTDASLFRLNGNCVRRVVARPITETLTAVEHATIGDILLNLTQEPVMWTIASPRTEIVDALASVSDPLLRERCLHALAPVCATTRIRVRERAMLSPVPPIKSNDPRLPVGGALEVALPSSSENRMFLRGWIRDPMQMVERAVLRGPLGNTPIALSDFHRFPRPDIAKQFSTAAFRGNDAELGFLAFVPDPTGGLSTQPTLALQLKGGGQIEIRPPARAADAATARSVVLASVRPVDVTNTLLERCLAPAASAFHREALAGSRTPTITRIGSPISNPTLSVIIPLYRNLSFLRFQIAAFAADTELRAAEFVFALDSPEQASEAEHLLRGLHAVHRLPMTLVVMPQNLGYAVANNVAADHCRAPLLLLLNSDVVPTGAPFLAKLQDALDRPEVAAVGPKLLFDDESIQHAGLLFRQDDTGLWLNAHFYKGMPRQWPAASVKRTVPGLTGAAILVKRDAFDRAGGICEDYVIGDYEDSDFCLRLRQQDKELVYVPEAELFHFERRSILSHSAYTETSASRYNRWLHHQRWDATITTLMRRPEFCPTARKLAA